MTKDHIIGLFFGVLTVIAAFFYNQGQETLADDAVITEALFRPVFVTEDSSFSAGSAVAIQLESFDTPVVITAHHLFGPSGGLEETIKSEDLHSFIKNVVFYNLFTENEIFQSNKVLVLTEADASEGIHKDLSAFLAVDYNIDATYSLSNKALKEGDRVWLLASLYLNEQEIHPGRIVEYTDERVIYQFDDSSLDLTASSGAPIINRNGEIIALNLGGQLSEEVLYGYGNPSVSMLKILNKAIHEMSR